MKLNAGGVRCSGFMNFRSTSRLVERDDKPRNDPMMLRSGGGGEDYTYQTLSSAPHRVGTELY